MPDFAAQETTINLMVHIYHMEMQQKNTLFPDQTTQVQQQESLFLISKGNQVHTAIHFPSKEQHFVLALELQRQQCLHARTSFKELPWNLGFVKSYLRLFSLKRKVL